MNAIPIIINMAPKNDNEYIVINNPILIKNTPNLFSSNVTIPIINMIKPIIGMDIREIINPRIIKINPIICLVSIFFTHLIFFRA